MPVKKRIQKFESLTLEFLENKDCTLGLLLSLTGTFVNLYTDTSLSLLISRTFYALIHKAYEKFDIDSSIHLTETEKNMIAQVPEDFKDAFVEFLMTNNLRQNIFSKKPSAFINPIFSAENNRLLDPLQNVTIITDAGASGMGCICVLCENDNIVVFPTDPEILGKTEKKTHSTLREIRAGIEALKKLYPKLHQRKARIVNWMTDSSATFLILEGSIIHSDETMNNCLIEFRNVLIQRGLELNVVWRRRNTPLLKYADMFTKMVPSNEDRRGRALKKQIKRFRRNFPQSSADIVPILGKGKLLENLHNSASRILSFPMSGTMLDDIFETLGTVPKKRMLILPKFPNRTYWTKLLNSNLKPQWTGKCQDMFPNNPNNIAMSLWW